MKQSKTSRTQAQQIAADFAASQAMLRAQVFLWNKRISKLPRKPMSQEVMQRICGHSGHSGHNSE